MAIFCDGFNPINPPTTYTRSVERRLFKKNRFWVTMIEPHYAGDPNPDITKFEIRKKDYDASCTDEQLFNIYNKIGWMR